MCVSLPLKSKKAFSDLLMQQQLEMQGLIDGEGKHGGEGRVMEKEVLGKKITMEGMEEKKETCINFNNKSISTFCITTRGIAVMVLGLI